MKQKKRPTKKPFLKSNLFFILKKQKQLCQMRLFMKATNLLYVLSLCSLLIFSSHGMESDDKENKNLGDNFEIIQNSTVKKQKETSLSLRFWSGIKGTSHTEQVYEYINTERILIDQGYHITLHDKIEKAIREQYKKIANINKLFDNSQIPTLQKMIDGKKHKSLPINKIKDLFNIAQINKLQIRDDIKTTTTNILEHEQSLEKDLIIKALTLSLKEHNELTESIQNIENNKLNTKDGEPQIDKLNMQQYIDFVTNKEPEKEKTKKEE